MPAGHPDGRNCFLPQLVRKLAQLIGLQPPEVRGRVDKVEERGGRALGHGRSFARLT
jgi:hypothetical protein